MPCKATILQSAAALFALLVGLLFYILSRPADSVYLFTLFSYSPTHYSNLFGVVGEWLPSFIHTYAFILLTVLVVGSGPRVIIISSLFWVGIGWLFEWGQHTVVSVHLVTHMPEWFSTIPVLENSANYFLYGTFDPLDLAAVVVGALAAWLTHRLAQNCEFRHGTDS
jgi:hypothetical protein